MARNSKRLHFLTGFAVWYFGDLLAFTLGWPSALTQRVVSVSRRGTERREKYTPKNKKQITVAQLVVNQAITSREVRLLGEYDIEEGMLMEKDDVLDTREALAMAESLGMDLVLVDEDEDPPTVNIIPKGVFAGMLRREAEAERAASKVPKVKEIRFQYTIGEHDLQYKVKNIEGWMKTPKQQVRVLCQMRGRTRAFEGLARNLLHRLTEEVAGYARPGGWSRNNDAIGKDGKGDLQMQLFEGPNLQLLKDLSERAKTELAAVEEEDDEEEEEEEEEEITDPLLLKLAEAKKGLEEVKEELLEAGFKEDRLKTVPEWIEANNKVKAAAAEVKKASVAADDDDDEGGGASSGDEGDDEEEEDPFADPRSKGGGKKGGKKGGRKRRR